MMPGIKKLLNGEGFNIDNGIPIKLPDGDRIKAPPPPMAPCPGNEFRWPARKMTKEL
ncbi:MAG: hypothetical protein ABI863_13360 [Ginsengibacter sp.]